MKRRTVIGIAAGAAILAAGGGFLLSDRRNLVRGDEEAEPESAGPNLLADERRILELASLAPSGHNTQPWSVQRLAPFHWIIGNDRRRWLPAVDPVQRETMLSIGAFAENLELAAGALGYACRWTGLGTTNQDPEVLNVALSPAPPSGFALSAITGRRTLRSGFSRATLSAPDLAHLIGPEGDHAHVGSFSAASPAGRWISEQTLSANRLQCGREPAQRELSQWIRFSSHDAARYRDGLTTAGMEITGVSGWIVRNFYDQTSVLGRDFRERGLAAVQSQVDACAGWILITSEDESVAGLLACGRRMERLFLRARERGIAIHPMTQILEEPSIHGHINQATGIAGRIQFILRTGQVAAYPPPVSLRRPVSWFVRS